MVMTIYKRALAVLMQKPLKLWGISLLAVALIPTLTSLCGVAIPVLGLAVSLLLSTSMLFIFLRGYRGEDIQVVQLFDCFKDWATIKRVLLGLGWMLLWIFLWGLIPVAGPIFALIRAYEYRLTPYILVSEPDVSITEAINVSKQRTNGYKLQMFLADILYGVIIFVAFLILGILCTIPILNVLIALVMLVAYIGVIILTPLFAGLVQAAFYEEIANPTIPVAPVYTTAAPAGYCTNCGAPYTSANAAFCTNCGAPKNP